MKSVFFKMKSVFFNMKSVGLGQSRWSEEAHGPTVLGTVVLEAWGGGHGPGAPAFVDRR
jgi:hypothetical protein